ncbi:PP2C family protein-serine/threonine phosphatase [Cytophagales bacterium LB-30]|uniref:PP2C family protein-serine/threonine phosphatase n=2 Tax=Shiella aurantiaca TaxID=3058365 RepID=A0ABT8F3R9_9BACT|nr:PP2C family protein-serine/threonine phosphatase [Shiella aurantiaca]
MLVVLDLVLLFSNMNNMKSGIRSELPHLLLSLFFVFLFIYYRYIIGKAETVNFIDLLWRVFVTGLLATIVSLAISFLFVLLGNNKISENALLINFFYHINLGLIAAFLISTFVVWKRLILYQKTRKLLLTWQVFEYSLMASILFNFLNFRLLDTSFIVLLVLLVVMGLILSFNLKWVAYLNFKQKWKSILLILLVILYLWYFLINLFNFSTKYVLVNDLLNNIFILALFGFIFLYAVISLLVILFNLPTSSVFEQKLEEVINFQRLSQSIQTGQNEDQVYDILLDSSVSAVFASAAWLELDPSAATPKNRKILFNLDELDCERVQATIEKSKLRLSVTDSIGQSNTSQFSGALKDSSFRSVLIMPLLVKGNETGRLVLLKDVADGFDKEMIDIIGTFVNQACVSIENFQLLNDALKNERYQEELKIAQRVQRSLLPDALDSNPDFDIIAFSEAADEVGGDYYDTYRISPTKIAVVIGDVSGKGTSAAFHMSQMKGIFHSLSQLDMGSKNFLIQANDALSRCLEKSSFITLSYFIIDSESRSVEFARAGHCPTLLYQAANNTADYFQNKGLGLGILRNENFSKYVFVNSFQYQAGDIVVLYTDGITEARNPSLEEFGVERLRKIVQDNHALEAKQIQEQIIQELYAHCGHNVLNDDYTVLVIKFK